MATLPHRPRATSAAAAALAFVTVLQAGVLLSQLAHTNLSTTAASNKAGRVPLLTPSVQSVPAPATVVSLVGMPRAMPLTVNRTQQDATATSAHSPRGEPRLMTGPYHCMTTTPFHHAATTGKLVLPNVVYLVADDLQSDDLNAGHTPNVDRISANGLRFANAHTPSPLCTPSRYSLLTGRHPSCAFYQKAAASDVEQINLNGSLAMLPDLPNIGFNINLPIPQRQSELQHVSGPGSRAVQQMQGTCSAPTIASILHERGYMTGICGKWRTCTSTLPVCVY